MPSATHTDVWRIQIPGIKFYDGENTPQDPTSLPAYIAVITRGSGIPADNSPSWQVATWTGGNLTAGWTMELVGGPTASANYQICGRVDGTVEKKRWISNAFQVT